MAGVEIKIGNVTYSVDAREHQRNLRVLRRLPEVLKRIEYLSRRFVGKPHFIVQQRGEFVSVVREDYCQQLEDLVRKREEQYFQRLTYSEWMEEKMYGETGLPITLHDVYREGDITIKTGNPHKNNAWEEFYRALYARYLGIVEAKSPLGFAFWLDDPYAVKRPGKMFYRHLEGQDLEQALKQGNAEQLNWAIWEAAKFFSRLINAHLYLEDADRLGNCFIEDGPATTVFRFLDLEAMPYLPVYNNRKKAEMLVKFIKKAIKERLLTAERLGEFVIVCSGANFAVAELVEKELFQTRLE